MIFEIRLCAIVLCLLANSPSAISEQSLRDEGKPLFGSLASRQLDCLCALVKFAAVANQAIHPEVIKKHCVTLLSGSVYIHSSLCMKFFLKCVINL